MTNTNLWQPPVGATWNLYLLNPINLTLWSQSPSYLVWDIDLFSNPTSTISTIQGNSSHVICYFSAGSYEDWRPDASNFTSSDLGSNLAGWPGEKWLNISSPNVRSIMTRRLDLAASKGCDGVDPDNVDGYSNSNGLSLTQQDSINYMNFLATEAGARNLSIGLKNAGEIVPQLVDRMHWSVSEQCHEDDECSLLSPFIQQGKPVFNVEYPKGAKTNDNNPVIVQQLQKACNTTNAKGFSTIIKNIDLDWFTESCNASVVGAPSGGNSGGSDSTNSNAGVKFSSTFVSKIVISLSLVIASGLTV